MTLDLRRDREWAAEALIDSCTVYADNADAEPTFDDTLGKVVYPDDAVVWQGPCSVSLGTALAGRPELIAADPQIVTTAIVRVPLDVVTIGEGHVVVIDAIHHGGDRALLGLELTVQNVGARSHAVVRRLRCTIRSKVGPS